MATSLYSLTTCVENPASPTFKKPANLAFRSISRMQDEPCAKKARERRMSRDAQNPFCRNPAGWNPAWQSWAQQPEASLVCSNGRPSPRGVDSETKSRRTHSDLLIQNEPNPRWTRLGHPRAGHAGSRHSDKLGPPLGQLGPVPQERYHPLDLERAGEPGRWRGLKRGCLLIGPIVPRAVSSSERD